jgi:hypothetical protein
VMFHTPIIGWPVSEAPPFHAFHDGKQRFRSSGVHFGLRRTNTSFQRLNSVSGLGLTKG